ncbi:MAG: 16S rRNA (cytidine(1402)-2'-O)-methyltransferase [Treponema sp.]|nr:16S rRNA (cytidine(1402)-2'-O)-methyltransferase [Treponema sp.]
MKGILYVTATPIGNTEDITLRAKRILGEAGVIAAEDTRSTQKLLSILGIKNKTVSNHKFNEKEKVDYLLSQLEEGKDVALVTDAGTPCISDPGNVITAAAAAAGYTVTGISGPSAVITALSVSGFSFRSFAFYGFLPRTKNEFKKLIAAVTGNAADTAVFYESPMRIKKSLGYFAETLPKTRLCLCNDLTKMYERIYRGSAGEILDELNANPSAEKGEYTLVADFTAVPVIAAGEDAAGQGPASESQADSASPGGLSCEAMIVDHVVKKGGSVKDAVKALSAAHRNKISKKEFYAASMRLKEIMQQTGGRDYSDLQENPAQENPDD